jgi:MFS family permease
MSKDKILGFLLICLLLVFYGSFLTHKINLVTADLGRHLANGRELIENHNLLKTNFYSYTEPDYPVISHHWGSGVIFYCLWKTMGFIGIQAFFIVLSIATFLISFCFAKKLGGYGLSGLLALGIIPLLAERTEIRPEIFSYLFVMVFLCMLWFFQENRLAPAWLLILPVLEVFWVNLHIFFFLGPLIILAFVIETLVKKNVSRQAKLKWLSLIFGLSVLATLVSPFGFRAVVEPFIIMKHYGYSIVENQPVWLAQRLIRNPNLIIFELLFFVLVLSYAVLFCKNRKALSPALFLLGSGASLMAWLEIRNLTLFGLLALPIMALNISQVFPSVVSGLRKLALFFLFIAVTISVSGNLTYLFPYWHEFGLGLERDNDRPARFIQEQKISGPILNNYDIGSYLIFYLFPEYRVFVDNRPEAYSVSFFQDVYIPLQDNESKWQEFKEKYGFNAIVFSYHDATPWAQKFLISRIQDQEWAPVYVDQYVIILLKRTAGNSGIIEKFEIPNSNFQILKTA